MKKQKPDFFISRTFYKDGLVSTGTSKIPSQY